MKHPKPFLPKSQILFFSLKRNSFCSNKRRRFPHACACFIGNQKRSTHTTTITTNTRTTTNTNTTTTTTKR